MLCVSCGKETKNPKFCSRGCSATWTNVHHKKRKLKDRFCTICGDKIGRKTHKDDSRLCDKHRNSWKFNDHVPLKSLVYIKHHKSSAFALVRYRARSIAKHLKLDKCFVCGYSTHVEICHIKPISAFPMDTMVSEINSPENLIPLCPTHHWELDRGILKL